MAEEQLAAPPAPGGPLPDLLQRAVQPPESLLADEGGVGPGERPQMALGQPQPRPGDGANLLLGIPRSL